MEAPSWQFDEARRQYYYWDASESCYVYQSGERIDPHPRDGYGCIEQAVTTNIEEGRPEDITEEGALQDGISAHKKIRETPGEAETLDPRFRRHYPGRDFYKIGKVFKVLWPEPAGNPQSGVTFITGPASYGEPIYAKIRWFVVIREGRDCCTCLPIQTYNRKGVSKKGVIKGEHSIVHTGPYPPSTPEWEDPREEMLQPIPVHPRDPAESKMDAMSRLNYAKPYTVEHNVKSLDFGDVPPEWIPTLRQNFITVLQLEQAGASPPFPGMQLLPECPLTLPTAPHRIISTRPVLLRTEVTLNIMLLVLEPEKDMTTTTAVRIAARNMPADTTGEAMATIISELEALFTHWPAQRRSPGAGNTIRSGLLEYEAESTHHVFISLQRIMSR